jgi:hypothetical protein
MTVGFAADEAAVTGRVTACTPCLAAMGLDVAPDCAVVVGGGGVAAATFLEQPDEMINNAKPENVKNALFIVLFS